MAITLDRVGDTLLDDFSYLVDSARREGHGMLDRLLHEWSTGELRFDRPGERLLVARLAGKIVGVGGITLDPVAVTSLRMRRFYVSPSARRYGIGAALMKALLEGVPRAQTVGVHVGVPEAFGFWEAVGFKPVAGGILTHQWDGFPRPF